MTNADRPRFFQALAAMGVMFSDELTKPRQQLYWDIFRTKMEIDQWEHICQQAMEYETFHKLPLPRTLWNYGEGFRQQARQRQYHAEYEAERLRLIAGEQARAQEQEAQRLLAEAQRPIDSWAIDDPSEAEVQDGYETA